MDLVISTFVALLAFTQGHSPTMANEHEQPPACESEPGSLDDDDDETDQLIQHTYACTCHYDDGSRDGRTESYQVCTSSPQTARMCANRLCERAHSEWGNVCSACRCEDTGRTCTGLCAPD